MILIDRAIQQMGFWGKFELLAECGAVTVAHVQNAYKPGQYITCVKTFRKKF
jgi:hypothetical protein